jgi:hypothetical protein
MAVLKSHGGSKRVTKKYSEDPFGWRGKSMPEKSSKARVITKEKRKEKNGKRS